MAEGAAVMDRAQLDAELEHLARMVSPWLCHLHSEGDFWPQFDALVAQILQRTRKRDQAYAQRYIDAIMVAHDLHRPGPPTPPAPAAPRYWLDG